MRWVDQLIGEKDGWVKRRILINPDHVVMVAAVELNSFEGTAVRVWLNVVLNGDMADVIVAHSMTEMQDTLTP